MEASPSPVNSRRNDATKFSRQALQGECNSVLLFRVWSVCRSALLVILGCQSRELFGGRMLRLLANDFSYNEPTGPTVAGPVKLGRRDREDAPRMGLGIGFISQRADLARGCRLTVCQGEFKSQKSAICGAFLCDSVDTLTRRKGKTGKNLSSIYGLIRIWLIGPSLLFSISSVYPLSVLEQKRWSSWFRTLKTL